MPVIIPSSFSVVYTAPNYVFTFSNPNYPTQTVPYWEIDFDLPLADADIVWVLTRSTGSFFVINYKWSSAPGPTALELPSRPTWVDGVISLRSGSAGISSVVAGNNIVVDSTDPINPIISVVEYHWRSALDPAFQGANDSITIQNTVDAVVALGGGKVVIPDSKVWTLPVAIDLTGVSDITLEGGRYTRILISNPSDWFFDTGNATNVKITGFQFEQPNGLFTSNYPINLDGTTNLLFEDNICIKSCLFNSAPAGFKMKDNKFYQGQDSALQFGGSLPDMLVEGNFFSTWAHYAGTGVDLDWTTAIAYPGVFTPAVGDVVASGDSVFVAAAVVGATSGTFPAVTDYILVDGGVTWNFVSSIISGGALFAPNGRLADLKIIKNTFKDLFDAIDSGLTDTQITDNYFSNCVYCWLLPSYWSVGDIIPVNNVKFQNNTVDECTSMVSIFDNTSTVNPVTWGSVIVSGNTFTDAQNFPLALTTLYPINLTLTNDITMTSLIVSGNTFSEYQEDAVHIDILAPANISSLLVTGNTFNTATGGIFAINPLAVTAPYLDQFICSNNIVTDGGGINGGAGTIAAVANRVIYANNATA